MTTEAALEFLNLRDLDLQFPIPWKEGLESCWELKASPRITGDQPWAPVLHPLLCIQLSTSWAVRVCEFSLAWDCIRPDGSRSFGARQSQVKLLTQSLVKSMTFSNWLFLAVRWRRILLGLGRIVSVRDLQEQTHTQMNWNEPIKPGGMGKIERTNWGIQEPDTGDSRLRPTGGHYCRLAWSTGAEEGGFRAAQRCSHSQDRWAKVARDVDRLGARARSPQMAFSPQPPISCWHLSLAVPNQRAGIFNPQGQPPGFRGLRGMEMGGRKNRETSTKVRSNYIWKLSCT